MQGAWPLKFQKILSGSPAHRNCPVSHNKVPLWPSFEAANFNHMTINNQIWLFFKAETTNPNTLNYLTLWDRLKLSYWLHSHTLLSFLSHPFFYSAHVAPASSSLNHIWHALVSPGYSLLPSVICLLAGAKRSSKF